MLLFAEMAAVFERLEQTVHPLIAEDLRIYFRQNLLNSHSVTAAYFRAAGMNEEQALDYLVTSFRLWRLSEERTSPDLHFST